MTQYVINSNKPFSFSQFIVAFPLYFVLLLWIIFWIEGNYDLYFTKYGLYPRTFTGLRGIVLSPFIHSGVKHLFNNYPTAVTARLYVGRTFVVK